LKSLRLDNRLPHPLFVPVLLAAVVLAVYYPAISNGFHSIDDPGIIALFSSPPPLIDILLPGRNYYYRPIIELSYYADSKLWGMEPSVMHLENILLHITNSMLVFLISRKVAANYPEHSPFIPVMAALLFALHPLNVEAVSWIAGRTDPLAALFILSASFLWLCWFDNPKWQYAVSTLLLFGLGILTKESALAFLPVSLLLVLAWPALPARRRLIAAGGIFVSVAMVVVAVALNWKSGVISLGRFLAYNDFDATGWWQNSLVAFGFYVKKLLMPLPLNFAITDVPPAYGLLGILSIIVLVVALVVWRLPALFFAASALMILPALILATKQIAWTPLAERYMYMPTAFLCIGTSCLLFLLQKKNLHRLAPLIILVACIAGAVSFQRNLLWKDKLAFYQDAVAKSPGFGSVYNELGGVFLQQRKIDKAAEAFAVADRLNKRPSMKMPIKSNIMATMVAKGSFVTARDYFFQLFGMKKVAPVEFLELLYIADNKQLEYLEKEKKVLLAHDLLETLGLLYQKKPDPFWLYQSGKMALVIGNTKEAADFFRRAYVAAPVDAHYKAAAKTYFLRLEAGK
jgi:tetratricopeptide (TPR) repeat protein